MRVVSIVACLGIVGAAEEASGQIAKYKLSGPLVAGGDVHRNFNPIFTPDSRYFVYSADQEVDEKWEVFRVPLLGGTPVKMNHAFTPPKTVRRFLQISPDGLHLLYEVEIDNFNPGRELFSVPTEGGIPVSLSAPLLTSGHDVVNYVVSPDSRTVVVRHEGPDGDDLYSVSIGGGPLVQLNGIIDAGLHVDVGGVQISPDSRTVGYDGRPDGGIVGVFSSPIQGGGFVRLSSDQHTQGNFFSDPLISPDSSRAVYVARPQDAEALERNLYSVPINGGPITKLFPTPGMETFRVTGDWVYSGDGTRVIFLAHDTTLFPDTVDTLYSVGIAGGTPIRLNPELPGIGEVRRVYATNPNSDRVVYMADQEEVGKLGFYSVPAGGGLSVRLNRALSDQETINVFAKVPVITPDGTRVVHILDQIGIPGGGTLEGIGVYSVPIDGGTAIMLNEDPGSITDFAISPDSSMVAYRTHTGISFELFAVGITGGPVSKLNGPLVEFGNVWGADVIGPQFAFSPDSSTVVYIADQEQDEVYEFFATKIREVVPPEVPTAGPYALAALALGLAVAGASSVARHSAARGKSWAGSSGAPYLRAGLLAMAAPRPEARGRKRDDKSA